MDNYEKGQHLNRLHQNSSLEVIQGPDSGKKVAFRSGMIIGRDAKDCHFKLSDANVSRQHTRVSMLSNGQFVIEDLQSTNGTWLSGQRLQTQVPLAAGETFQVGSSLLRLNVDSFDAEEQQITIGREQGNTLAINDQDVSRQHALLHFRNGQLVVTDLNSTNGTFVDNRKINGAAVLQPGAVLSIGHEKYLFNDKQLRSLQGGQVIYDFCPGRLVADEPMTGEQANARPLSVKKGLAKTFLMPGAFFCGISLLALVYQFQLFAFLTFLVILGFMFVIRDKIAGNFKRSVASWLVALFIFLLVSALGTPGVFSFGSAIMMAGLKMISIVIVLVFILSNLLMIFSFRKPKKVSLPAVILILAVSVVSLVLYSTLIGYRSSFGVWFLTALAGVVIGYLWARSTSVYLENNQVMSRNSGWYLLTWAAVFTLNQVITIITNRPPALAMALLIMSTFIVWGTNVSIMQRYLRLQPVSLS